MPPPTDSNRTGASGGVGVNSTAAPSDGESDCSGQKELVRSLCDASVYDHPVQDIRLIETHISYLILTGTYAYKIKKALRLSFLDFSTLAMRRFYCREEQRLNQRLAADIYAGVVPITGSGKHPVLNGPGQAIEYAVKMIQFDTSKELDLLVDKGGLDDGMIAALADRVADFHQRVDRAGAGDEHGTPDVIRRRISDNFGSIAPCVATESCKIFESLKVWVDHRLTALRCDFEYRKRHGFVRECHGDMHLGNMVLVEGQIRLFDCLEFNEELRWIDVMSEAAFLVMDLDHHGRLDLGFRFLNGYLSATGDYAGLKLFSLYLVYRAMVRAKVACIRNLQGVDSNSGGEDVVAHLELARRYTRPPSPMLLITHGVSGSGKSWWSERIAGLLPSIHIRSDVERSRAMDFSAVPEPIGERCVRYSAENIERTYTRLLELAGCILRAGFSVIVDATFLRAKYRQRFRNLARELGVAVRILDFQCPEEMLRERIVERRHRGKDPSEATLRVLQMQLEHEQSLTVNECGIAIVIRAEEKCTPADLVQRISSSA